MIWSRGEVLPDDGLTLSVTDRTFEHGLGLFETLRTWNGRTPLLPAHRSRMLRSAQILGIPIDPHDFPDDRAIADLLEAQGSIDDQILRITATGGSTDRASTVWMRSRPLGPLAIGGPSKIRLGPASIGLDDPLARFKTLNYWSRRLAMESARDSGFDEILIRSSSGGYSEGSVTNVFVVVGDELITPSMDAPIVPGIIRGLILHLAGSLPIRVREVESITDAQLESAAEVFLTNSVRGIVPVSRAEEPLTGRVLGWVAPGPWTDRLRGLLADYLEIPS